MKHVLTLTLLMLGSLAMQAQQTPHKCGYDHAVEIMEQKHPGFREAANRTFSDAKHHSFPAMREEVYTIPVVVHVVWQTPEQNIPDTQIQAVIDRLNEDYRHTNANAANIREVFQDLETDPFIEFCLNEVIRVETDTTFALNVFAGTLPDNVKLSAEGGSDAIDPSSYLNMWVCNIDGGALLGYAYPPAGLDNWPEGSSASSPGLDGVVVHTPAFNVGSALNVQGTSVSVEGRTVTHEVGHYLGLRHIWGDGLLAQFGVPDCQADDGVEDTPQQGLPSSFVCDTTQNTCTDGSPDLPDMFENYMDYADELCTSIFTPGQVAIMRGVLESQRNGLLGSGCSPVSNDRIQWGGFSLKPNPFTQQFSVDLDVQAATAIQLRVFNAQGQLVASQSSPARQGQHTVGFDSSDWPQGVYFLQMSDGKTSGSQRLLKL